MYNFLKWLYLDIWLPANFYFSVLYGQVSQVKFLMEIMLLVGLGYFYLTGDRMTHKELLVSFIILFLLGIAAGYWLVRLGVPQKGNKLGNQVNPQIVEILEILKRLDKK